MRVERLWLKNFRGFPQLELAFHDKINVLVGINGAGKSSILDSLAILLSRVSAAVISPKASGRQFVEDDIKNGTPTTSNTIVVTLDSGSYRWNVAKTRRGKPHEESSSIQEARNIAEQLQRRFAADEKASLPLFVYYPVNRAVLDIPLRIKGKHVFDQLSAYDGALTGAQNNFRIFFEWFRNREDIENEEFRKNREEGLVATGGTYLDPQLEAVRNAITTFLPGFRKLRVKRNPLRMTIEKDGKELIINQLSDGEKCTLAMVGDLARRLATANPGLEDALQGRGIVLIDEVDLHMHPSWQRRVVPALAGTFANCQFILSTHSPQVVSEVRSASIWMISLDAPALHPDGAYGLDSNRILEDIMDVPERPQEIKEKIEELFDKIDRGQYRQAKEGVAELRTTIGDDPELTKAEVLIRRKEILGK